MPKCLLCEEHETLHDIEMAPVREYSEQKPQSMKSQANAQGLGKKAGKPIEDLIDGAYIPKNTSKKLNCAKYTYYEQPKYQTIKCYDFLKKLVMPELIAVGDSTHTINAEKLVHQVISKAYNMNKVHDTNYEQGDILLIVDHSGSCERMAQSSVPAAFWLAERYPHIKVIFANNEYPTFIYGQGTKNYVKVFAKEDEALRAGVKHNIQAWKNIFKALDVKTLVCFSDEHEFPQYEAAQDIERLILFSHRSLEVLRQYRTNYQMNSFQRKVEKKLHFAHVFTGAYTMLDAIKQTKEVRLKPQGVWL